MDSKLKWVLQSRKFWASAVGLALILITAWGQDPYPTDMVVTAIMGVIAAFVAATAYEDGKQAEAAGRIGAADATAAVAATTTTVTTPSENVTVTTEEAKPTEATPPVVGRMGLE